MSHNTHTYTHTADMTESRAAEEDSVVARWRTPILFVQQPTFNHPLLSSFSFSLSPFFLSSALFSCCSWQWWWKDFWGYHSSSRPLLSVGESLPLLRAQPGCKKLAALSLAIFPSLHLSLRTSFSVYSFLIKIATLASFSFTSLSYLLGLCAVMCAFFIYTDWNLTAFFKS